MSEARFRVGQYVTFKWPLEMEEEKSGVITSLLPSLAEVAVEEGMPCFESRQDDQQAYLVQVIPGPAYIIPEARIVRAWARDAATRDEEAI